MEQLGGGEMEIREERPRATIEEIVAEAESIWAKVRPKKEEARAVERGKRGEELLAMVQADHANFARSFPVVVRWMAQLGKFSKSALSKFLKYHASQDPKSLEDFLSLQVEYPVCCYEEELKKKGMHDRRTVGIYRQKLLENLKQEREDFEEAVRRRQAEEKEEEEKLRRELLESLRGGGAPVGAGDAGAGGPGPAAGPAGGPPGAARGERRRGGEGGGGEG